MGPLTLGSGSATMHLQVDDADAVVRRAAEAGAEIEGEPEDQFYGERSGWVRNPFSHRWNIGHSLEEVTPEEMQRWSLNRKVRGFTAVVVGPAHKFTPALSFMVSCDSQEEIDYFWDRLANEGALGQCGWLNDKFGVSWQVVPTILPELMRGAPEAVVESVLTMTKINIEQLRAHPRQDERKARHCPFGTGRKPCYPFRQSSCCPANLL